MELYLNPTIEGESSLDAHIVNAAAIVVDDRGTELEAFEAISHEELKVFLDSHPSARLHALRDDRDRALFEQVPWNLGKRFWGRSVISAAANALVEMGLMRNLSHVPSLEEAARMFEIPCDAGVGKLSATRMSARVHLAIRQRLRTYVAVGEEASYFLEHGF